MDKPERDMRDGWRHAASHDLVRLVLLELMEPLKHDMSEERYVNDDGQQAKVAYAKYIYNRVREVDEPLAARLLGDCLGGIGWENWQTKKSRPKQSLTKPEQQDQKLPATVPEPLQVPSLQPKPRHPLEASNPELSLE